MGLGGGRARGRGGVFFVSALLGLGTLGLWLMMRVSGRVRPPQPPPSLLSRPRNASRPYVGIKSLQPDKPFVRNDPGYRYACSLPPPDRWTEEGRAGGGCRRRRCRRRPA